MSDNNLCKCQVTLQDNDKDNLDLYNSISKYYINLDSRIDRQQAFQDQVGTDFSRVSAISYCDANFAQIVAKDFDISYSKRKYQVDLFVGQIACTLSHFKIYQQVMQDDTIADQDWVLISEDDSYFIAEFKLRLNQILHFLQQERFEHLELVLLRYYRFTEFLDFVPELHSYDRVTKTICVSHPDKEKLIDSEIFNIHLRASHPKYQVFGFEYQNLPSTTALNDNLLSSKQNFIVANKLAPYSSGLYLIKKKTIKRILAKYDKAHWITDDFKSLIPKQNIFVASPCLAIENPSVANTDIQIGQAVTNTYTTRVYDTPEKWQMTVLKFVPQIFSTNFSIYPKVRLFSNILQTILGLEK